MPLINIFYKKAFLRQIILLNIFALNLFAQIPSPEKIIGFQPGEEKKLFGWDKITKYFSMLNEKSDRVQVQTLGQTTLGKPFIWALISAPNNLRNLARYKNLQNQAAKPYHLSDADARLLASQNKLVTAVFFNIQGDEIASSQAAVQLAYLLANGNSPEIKSVLDNVIILFIPSLNPDGMQLVVDWYDKYVNTPYEGAPVPFLTHHYAGRENDDDWTFANLVETRLVTKQLYQEWFPQVLWGIKKATDRGRRLRIPLTAILPNNSLNQLMVKNSNELQRQIIQKMLQKNVTGITNDAKNFTWSAGKTLNICWWHNMMGITAEVVNSQFGSPIFFPKGSLRISDHKTNNHHLLKWKEGWWRLSDAIDYEIKATMTFLQTIAAEKDSIIYHFCKMNLEEIRKGKEEAPFAYIIPAQQPEPVAMVQMVQALMLHGVTVHKVSKDIHTDEMNLKQNDLVILLSQPLRPYIKNMLDKQQYTQKFYHERNAVRPTPSGWTLPLMMDVDVYPANKPFNAALSELTSIRYPRAKLHSQGKGDYLIHHRSNRSFIAVNRLLDENKKVYWLKNEMQIHNATYPPGAIYIPHKELIADKMDFMSQELSLPMEQVKADFSGQPAFRIKKFKLALYQPWNPTPDEGWTRFLLEQFFFKFQTIYSSNIRKNNLHNAYDVIIIPDMPLDTLIYGNSRNENSMYLPKTPKPYLYGLMEDGIENLRQFVLKGGTLITLNRSCDLPIKRFGIPAENILDFEQTKRFYCPGSLLRIMNNNKEAIGYGMSDNSPAFFLNSRAFKPKPWQHKTNVIAYYSENELLLSGFISGGDILKGAAAVLDIPLGKGRIVLIGFNSQYQAKTPVTYKFLFNAIQMSAAKAIVLKK